jgi:uncharacterized protein YdaU (DUF1376 family)
MKQALPYARIFLNDILGECIAHGLSLRARGILLNLLWVQHMNGGSIPADLRELRRLVGDDAEPEEIEAVVAHFFPLTEKDRRSNPQHAEAQAAALRAYEATVRGGQIRAAQMWGGHSSATSSATSSGGSNQNQNQNYNKNPKKKTTAEPGGSDAPAGRVEVDGRPETGGTLVSDEPSQIPGATATASRSENGESPSSGEPDEFTGWATFRAAIAARYGEHPERFDVGVQRAAYLANRRRGVSHGELLRQALAEPEESAA